MGRGRLGAPQRHGRDEPFLCLIFGFENPVVSKAKKFGTNEIKGKSKQTPKKKKKQKIKSKNLCNGNKKVGGKRPDEQDYKAVTSMQRLCVDKFIPKTRLLFV